MTTVKTDPKLLEALREAAKQKMTAEQRRRQMVSGVMSMIDDDSDITRADVEKMISDKYGLEAAG